MSRIRTPRRASVFASAVFAACSTAGSLLAADTTYVGPAAGNWDTASNWNNGTPTLSNLAFVDNGAAGNVVVTIGSGLTRNVGTLHISAGDAVAVSNNSFLQVSGNGTDALLNNCGELQVNAGANSTRLRFTNAANGIGTISGGGTILLNGANATIDGGGSVRVVNVDNHIRGQGSIGAEVITLSNFGTISADVNGGTLTLDPDANSGTNSFFLNGGAYLATNGGVLVLTGSTGGTFSNVNGTIEAQNNSFVRLISGASVTGGTLTSSGTGSVRVSTGQNGFLSNLTNNGMLIGENNSDLGIATSLVNNGTVSIESSGNATDLEIQSDTTISGTGVIFLRAANAGIDGVAGTRLTLGPGQTLRGEGRVCQEVITLTNNGTILADVNGGTMTFDPDANSGTNSFLLNNGLMRATNAGVMVFTGSTGGTFSNAAGRIEADNASTISLVANADITGGTLATFGDSAIRVGAGQNAFFRSVTLEGVLIGENNSDTGIATSLVNNGTIRIESVANATDLEIQNDTTISGVGTIVLANALAGIDGVAGSRLTLGPGQTVRGQGRIGQEVITVTNNGTILADISGGTLTLDPDANSGTNSFFLNNGVVRATSDGTLVLTGANGGTFSNAAGRIEADNGSEVLLVNFASVTGGTFTTNGSGSIRVDVSQDAFFNNVTNNGLMVGDNNSDFGIGTGMVNNGTISIESTGATTDLEIQNDVTISGTGVIILSGPSAGVNGVAGSRLTLGPGQVLRGRGSVLQEVITLTNDGIVSADVPGATLTLDPDANSGTNSFLLNNGTLRATNGGILRLTGASGGTFTGNGPVIADAGSTVEALASTIATIGPVSGTGTAAISGASNFQARHYRVGTLSVSSATARVAAGSGTLGTSKVSSLTVVGTGRLDLTDNDLVLDYTGASPIASIRPLIASAYGSGSWTGVGLTSTSAAAAAATSDKTGLGYAEATQILTTPTQFSGVPIDGTSILVAYTLLGDSNLDLKVDIDDFGALATNFNQPSTWFSGDFNYSGTTDIDDFGLLASNFNKMLAADLPRGSAVPEPETLAAGVWAALMVRSRRRRA